MKKLIKTIFYQKSFKNNKKIKDKHLVMNLIKTNRNKIKSNNHKNCN